MPWYGLTLLRKNIFGYVGGDPVSRFDSFGLQDRTARYIQNDLIGQPNQGNITSAILHDGMQAYLAGLRETALTGLRFGSCTLVCGIDATIGTSFESMRNNAIQSGAYKGVDVGIKKVTADVASACMSSGVDKIAANITSKVTPVVNGVSGLHTVYQFGSCVLRCGN